MDDIPALRGWEVNKFAPGVFALRLSWQVTPASPVVSGQWVQLTPHVARQLIEVLQKTVAQVEGPSGASGSDQSLH